MSQTAVLLFEYLRAIVYNSNNAQLDIDELDEDYKSLGRGLKYFADCLKEEREFAYELARGNLHFAVPDKTNHIAAPLKELHSVLVHLTWQTKQVADGDYSQTIDFMGEFADAFNKMVKQLKQRQYQLEVEADEINRKSMALKQNHRFFLEIMEKMSELVIVIDNDDNLILYCNKMYREYFSDKFRDKENQFIEILLRERKRSEDLNDSFEYDLVYKDKYSFSNSQDTYYFHVSANLINWKDRTATAYFLNDITEYKVTENSMKELIYNDPLTGVYNRRYGMELIGKLFRKKHFMVSYVDLDKLKYTNDRFGHSEGDNYIISVADALNKIKGIRRICRIGGDEFMIIWENTSKLEADMQLEKIRALLISESKAENINYTKSFSYGTADIDDYEDISIEDLIRAADHKMYEYKLKHKLSMANML